MWQRLGLRPRLSTACSADSGAYYYYHLVSHRLADEDTEEGQTLVLASFANLYVGPCHILEERSLCDGVVWRGQASMLEQGETERQP